MGSRARAEFVGEIFGLAALVQPLSAESWRVTPLGRLTAVTINDKQMAALTIVDDQCFVSSYAPTMRFAGGPGFFNCMMLSLEGRG